MLDAAYNGHRDIMHTLAAEHPQFGRPDEILANQHCSKRDRAHGVGQINLNTQGMNPGPKVTVVIPAYNAERHIGRTIDSILAQRDVNLEVYIVDDQSTDGTRALIMDFASKDSRVLYTQTAANFGGPAGPRNLGVQNSRSEWVAFCDSDDLWHPDKLRAQLDSAQSTGAGLICTSIESFRDGVEPSSFCAPLAAKPTVRRIGLWAMLFKNRIATSSVLCRRQLILDAQGFNTDRGMIAVEDYDLWLRLMTQFDTEVVQVVQKLVGYRHLGGSLSAGKLQQAGKIMRVHKSIFAFQGWNGVFPLAAPVLMLCYVASWLYLRTLVTRRNATEI
jgi:teichuronic acid biosynthesis glycosyltransferase TuaG